MTKTRPFVEAEHPRADDGRFMDKAKRGRPDLDSDISFNEGAARPIAAIREMRPLQLGYPGAASMAYEGSPARSIPSLAPSYTLRKWAFVERSPQDFKRIQAAMLDGIHALERREWREYANTGMGSPYAPGQVDVQQDWLVRAYAKGIPSEQATWPVNEEKIWDRAKAEAATRANLNHFRDTLALSLEERLRASAAAAYSAYHSSDITDSVTAFGLRRILSLVTSATEEHLDRLEDEAVVAWQNTPEALEHTPTRSTRGEPGLEAHPAAEQMSAAFWDSIHDGSFADAIAAQARQPGRTDARDRAQADYWENTKFRGDEALMFWHSNRPRNAQHAEQLALLLIEGIPVPKRLRYGSDQLHAMRGLIDEAEASGSGEAIEVALARAPDGTGYQCYYRDDLPLGRRAAVALGLRSEE